ncbi:MAG: alpha/beta hydrolase [Streptosporangiaceae bacterium]
MNPVQQRVSRVLALEPGGAPTRAAGIANRIIRATARAAWAASPNTDAGLRAFQWVTGRVPGRVPPGVKIVPESFGEFTGEWVRAGRVHEDRVFLYLHGGGYFFGNPRIYRGFSWRLSASTRRAVLMVDYRLVPEHTPADALADALVAYEALLARGIEAHNIVVGGDSAGGHLALSLLHTLKRRGLPQPSAAVVISPWADIACAAESHRLNERTDHLIPAVKLAWLGSRFCAGLAEDDALYAPIAGDYRGLPRLMVIASGSEILRDDARLVARLAADAGIEVVHQEWEGLVHVFPVFADFIPEGKAAFRHIADFLRRS